MSKSTEEKVKELVAAYKLEEALDTLIAEAQHQTQRKQNALLVLKGKLHMLEEQALNGILPQAELDRQRAEIAHRILDIADGSPLDREPPPVPTEPQAPVQKTVAPTARLGGARYLLLGGLLVAALVAGFLFAKNRGGTGSANTAQNGRQPPAPEQAERPRYPAGQDDAPPTPGGPLKLLNFPNLQQPFNFLDFGVEFSRAEADWASDTEIRLDIRYHLTCKSNLGVCYRAGLRIYADGRPFAATDQSNLDGWVAHKASITDDIRFLLPADAKSFEIELSRDKSTWRRPFQILVGR